jgi:hypothetical protein
MTLSYFFTRIETPLGVILRPLMPVTLKHSTSDSLDTLMLIDSGADLSMIPKSMAQSIGIDLSSCPTGVTGGVGGATDVVMSEATLSFGQRKEVHEVDIPVQIPTKTDIPSPLLGREPFFRFFDVSFRMGFCEDKGKFVIKEVTKVHRSSDYPDVPTFGIMKYILERSQACAISPALE